MSNLPLHLVAIQGGFLALKGATYIDSDIPAGNDIITIKGDIDRPNEVTHITIYPTASTATFYPIPFEVGEQFTIVTGYSYMFQENCLIYYGIRTV